MFSCYIIYLISLREIYINIFNKKILLLVKNDKIINVNFIQMKCINFLYYFGLKYIIQYYKINIVYKVDNLIRYNDYKTIKNSKINKIIINVELFSNNCLIEFIEKFKLYSLNMPIFIIMNLENIDENQNIRITFLNKTSYKNIEYKLCDIKYKQICELV